MLLEPNGFLKTVDVFVNSECIHLYISYCISLLLNWAHIFVDQHTTHKIDHTIYSAIEEWNSAKMAYNYELFH